MTFGAMLNLTHPLVGQGVKAGTGWANPNASGNVKVCGAHVTFPSGCTAGVVINTHTLDASL